MTTYHHGDLRAALLRAAGELLEKQGPGSLKLRQVTRRAGVSHNAPYRHFPNRDALFAALAEEGFVVLGGRLEEAGRRGGREMGEAYIGFALDHPQRFRLMFGGQIEIDRHAGLRERAARAHAVLQQAFAWVGSEREAALAAAAAWSLVHGLAQLLLDGHLARAAAGAARRAFAREVLGAMRFALVAQRAA